MESVTCCLSTWVTETALPSALSLGCGVFLGVWKTISEQLSYVALKTFGLGQGPKILVQATGQLARS